MPGANTIGGVLYFTNGFDTSTQGMDIVATYPLTDVTNITAAINWNDTEFDSSTEQVGQFLNVESQYDFENFMSNWRSNFTVIHIIDDLRLLARASYYGESENSNRNPWPNIQHYDGAWFIDVEATYRLNDMFTITVGGRNIGDEYPEKDAISDYCCGRVYGSGSYMDWQGTYYYGRISANF